MRRFLLIGICFLLTGCCAGDDFLTFSSSGSTPRWGEPDQFFTEGEVPTLEVWFAEQKEVTGEPLEFYESGAQVEVASTRRVNDNHLENGCGFSNVITYETDALPVGDYTMVHRRSTGTGDMLNCTDQCPWTMFDGEEALTVDFQIVARP